MTHLKAQCALERISREIDLRFQSGVNRNPFEVPFCGLTQAAHAETFLFGQRVATYLLSACYEVSSTLQNGLRLIRGIYPQDARYNRFFRYNRHRLKILPDRYRCNECSSILGAPASWSVETGSLT